ncbi:MAG: hypothetical protein KA419_18420 [Acidobacteria bacterium]|nr:hypothetical protein [Acidobacteriota bacterium]
MCTRFRKARFVVRLVSAVLLTTAARSATPAPGPAATTGAPAGQAVPAHSAPVTETDPPARPLVFTVPTPDGGTLRAEYHFDHNALRQVMAGPAGWIARTASGTLLRFGRESFKLEWQAVGPARATCLAASDAGDVWAAFEDGRVCSVDPVTLELREIARLPGRVTWLGAPPGLGPESRKVVAVTDGTPRSGPESEMTEMELTRYRLQRLEEEPLSQEAWVLPGGPHQRIQPLSFSDTWKTKPDTYFIDSSLRLWTSVVIGDIGYKGACAVMDLFTGWSAPIPSGGRCIRGFTESRDGRVLAFGGWTQIFPQESFVARIDRGRWETLREWSRRAGLLPGEKPEDLYKMKTGEDGGPIKPIDTLAEDPWTGEFLVLSTDSMSTVDANFRSWTPPVTRVLPGRGEVSGIEEFSFQMTDLVSLKGCTGTWLGFPSLQGLILLADTGFFALPMPFQLGYSHGNHPSEIANSGDSSWFFPCWAGSEAAWRFADGRWTAVGSFPLEIRNADGTASVWKRTSWYDSRFLGVSGEDALLVCESPRSPGEVIFSRWSAGKATMEGSSRAGEGNLYGIFFTPDGQMWSVYGRELVKWAGDDFQACGGIGPLPIPTGTVRKQSWHDITVFPSTRDTGTVFLLMPGDYLVRFSFGDPAQPAWTLLDPEWRGEPIGVVNDVVVETAGTLLILTPRGLFRCDPDSMTLERILVEESPKDLRSTCIDSLGRLWVVGRQLHLSEDAGRTFRPAIDLPVSAFPERVRIRPDPRAPGEAALTLHNRGVVFLHWP